MGEVYVARDTKLDRNVALKVLPPELASNPDRRARFEREAKSLAALNHPNIVAIHSVEESEGVSFLTMELVEGKRLGELIPDRGMELERFLELATQLVDALEAAHKKGVVHRDLKPENVMVTATGRVKVLDFGLAKLRPELDDDEASQLPTRSHSGVGRVVGTIAYMSPEQAQGQPVDARSDLFSLGVLFYEMLTGRRPFQGDNALSVLSAILRDAPTPMTELRPDLPPECARIVTRCLEKEPDTRFPSSRDVADALGAVPRAAELRTRHRRPVVVAAGAVALVLFGTIFYLIGRQSPVPGSGVSGRPTVGVLTFEDHTNDADLEWIREGLPRMLSTDLAQTPGVDVVPRDQIEGLGSGQENTLAQLGERTGAGLLVTGDVYRERETYRVELQLYDVARGHIADAARGEGSDLFALADELSQRIRESLDGVEKSEAERPLDAITTESIRAYALYSEGAALNVESHQQANAKFQEAIAIDPEFALAYFELSRSPGLDLKTRREYEEKTLELLDRLPERDRRIVEAELQRREDPRAAAAILEELISRFPDETRAYEMLAAIRERELGEDAEVVWNRALREVPRWGWAHNEMGARLSNEGRYLDALEHFETYAALEPNRANPLDSIAYTYLEMGQPEKAIEHFERAIAINPEIGFSLRGRIVALTQLERYEEALERLRELPAVGDFMPLRPWILSLAGRFDEAEAGLASPPEIPWIRAVAAMLRADLALQRSRPKEALEHANEARDWTERLSIPTARSRVWFRMAANLYGALAEIAAGDVDAARQRLPLQRALLDEVQPDVRATWWYQSLRGEVALAEGNPREALEAFRDGEPERKFPGHPAAMVDGWTVLSRTGVARAFEALGMYREALDAYRTLSTPDLAAKWSRYPMDPRDVLHIARLESQLGDDDVAGREYERFLELWSDADEDRSELAEARDYLALR